MIIQLNRKVEYPDIVNGQKSKRVLEIGQHTVNDASIEHPFIKGLISSGEIILFGDKVPDQKKLVYPKNPREIVDRIVVRGVRGVDEIQPAQPKEEAPAVVVSADEIAKIKAHLNGGDGQKAPEAETKKAKKEATVKIKKRK